MAINYRMKKRNSLTYVLVVFAFILIAVFSTIAISGAWFTDSVQKNNTNMMTLGSVSIAFDNENQVGNVYNLTLTSTELLPNLDNNDDPIPFTRNLVVKNTGTATCYVRFSVSMTINDVATDIIQLQSVTTNSVAWKYDSGYYIYVVNNTTAQQLAANTSVDIEMSFVIDESFGNQYAGLPVQITFDVDAIQSANNSPTLSQTTWGNS